MSKTENAFISGTIDLLAGSAGGCATVMVGQPLDTVKVKMQTFPQLHPNPWNCFLNTLRKEGVLRGLYAGTSPALIANVAENSVLFCSYGFCQQFVSTVRGGDHSLTTLDKALSGFLAAFFSSFTLCPTELVKCKLQSLREQGKAAISPFSLTKSILQHEGIAGLFRGLTATMAREMPGYFFFFGGYEWTRSAFKRRLKTEELGLFPTIVAGGVGGIALWTSIFPFDVCKSRIQVHSSSLSMTRVLITIAREEGVRALYKGLTPTLVRTFPGTGALFVAYEHTKHVLTKITQNV